MSDEAHEFPRTVQEAVRLLQRLVPEPEQAKIAAMSEDELINLHFGLGMWIRNNLGLWEPSSVLVWATGAAEPDDASTVIIKAFWQRLRDDLPKFH